MTKTRLSWATSFLVNQSKSKKKNKTKKTNRKKESKTKKKKKRCAWNGNGSLRCWWIYFKWKNEYNLHMILARLRYNFSLEEHEKKNNEEEVVENSQIETHQGQWASENSLHILFGFRYGAAVVVVAVTFLYKKGTAPFQEADFFCFINRCREFKSELRFHGQFSVLKWLQNVTNYMKENRKCHDKENNNSSVSK